MQSSIKSSSEQKAQLPHFGLFQIKLKITNQIHNQVYLMSAVEYWGQEDLHLFCTFLAFVLFFLSSVSTIILTISFFHGICKSSWYSLCLTQKNLLIKDPAADGCALYDDDYCDYKCIICVLYDSVEQLQELLSSLVWRSSPKKQKTSTNLE